SRKSAGVLPVTSLRVGRIEHLVFGQIDIVAPKRRFCRSITCVRYSPSDINALARIAGGRRVQGRDAQIRKWTLRDLQHSTRSSAVVSLMSSFNDVVAGVRADNHVKRAGQPIGKIHSRRGLVALPNKQGAGVPKRTKLDIIGPSRWADRQINRVLPRCGGS